MKKGKFGGLRLTGKSIIDGNLLKVQAILVGFLLMVSGIFMAPLIGAKTNMTNTPNSRISDPDPDANDFEPILIVNYPNPPDGPFENNETKLVPLNITVTEWDVYYNGSKISSVLIDLNPLGLSSNEYMGYWPLPGDNTSANAGRYVYNLSIPNSVIPGDYNLSINATDNGYPGGGGTGKLSNTSHSFSLKVSQANRAPRVRDYGEGLVDTIDGVEDGGDNLKYYLNINDSVFIDADLEDGPFNNTTPDTVSFQIWNGTEWLGADMVVDFILFDAVISSSLDGNVTFTLKPDMFGEQNVNFNATDSKGEWVTHEVIITILNVNDPPYWDPVPPDITVEEGTPYNLSAKAADSDSSELYFSAHLFTANASWEIMPISGTENNYANFSLNFDNYEVYLDETSGLCINLTVNDGEYYESTIIDLEVTNVNDKPELHYSDSFDNKLGNFEVMEDGELEFSLLGIDEDFNEELQFDFDVMKFPKYADEPSYMEIAKLNFTTLTPGTAEDYINDYSELMYYNNFTTVVPAEFRFMPDNNDVGYLDINFSVDDMGGESDWVVANISILNTNDAPYFTQVGHYDATSGEHPIVDYTGLSNNATVGEEFKFEVVARDDDFPHDPMEELEFYTENVSLISDGVLEIEQGGNINASIIFNFTEKYIGINLINLTVIDNAGEIDWAWVMVEVWQGPDGAENNPPIANFTFSPSSPYKNENVTFDASDSYDPDDDDTLEYSWNFGDDSDYFSGIIVKHIFSEAGTYNVILTVTDGEGASEEIEKGIIILDLEDSDEDGMPDSWEEDYNLTIGVDDSLEDPDLDGRGNLQEYLDGTDPEKADDFDNDGLPDDWEMKYFGDYTKYSGNDDPNGDGLPLDEEYAKDLDPLKKEEEAEESPFSMGLFDYDIFIILIIIVIIIVILAAVATSRKKKEVPEEEEEPRIEEEAPPPPLEEEELPPPPSEEEAAPPPPEEEVPPPVEEEEPVQEEEPEVEEELPAEEELPTDEELIAEGDEIVEEEAEEEEAEPVEEKPVEEEEEVDKLDEILDKYLKK